MNKLIYILNFSKENLDDSFKEKLTDAVMSEFKTKIISSVLPMVSLIADKIEENKNRDIFSANRG